MSGGCLWLLATSLPTYQIRHPSEKGFPGSPAGKEFACNAGDPGSIPQLGRSPGEGVGYPLWYSQTSLVAQMVKKPPAMQETWIRSLGREDPLEEGMAAHSSMLAWRIPMDRGAWGHKELDTTERLNTAQRRHPNVKAPRVVIENELSDYQTILTYSSYSLSLSANLQLF